MTLRKFAIIIVILIIISAPAYPACVGNNSSNTEMSSMGPGKNVKARVKQRMTRTKKTIKKPNKSKKKTAPSKGQSTPGS
jgi:hypothetical protein